MSNLFIIGVDPGNTGALAILTARGEFHSLYDMPTIQVQSGKSVKERISAPQLWAIFYGLRSAVGMSDALFYMYMERLVAMPVRGKDGERKMAGGAVSIGNFFRGGGLLEMAAAAAAIPVTEVPAATWKAAARLPANKDASRNRVTQLFPQQADVFKRVKDHNRAEAVLIGLYGVQDMSKRGQT